MPTDKMSPRIVFFGTPEFAVASLDRLLAEGYNVVGVVTMPDKTGGRGKRVIESDVKRYAVGKGLPLLQPVSLKDAAFVEALRAWRADLQIVIAFRMLPEVVWSMPRLGTFNLHASLLPKYRGAAPINWAVINGDSQTGVTTFFLNRDIDTGDIIMQRAAAIGPEDDAGAVHDRLMALGADVVVQTVEAILQGSAQATPQSELAADVAPTPAPKIFTHTCRVDWDRPARELHNFVRGLSPHPAAWTELAFAGGQKTRSKIFKTALPSDEVISYFGQMEAGAAEPGTLRTDGRRMAVACAGGEWLEIVELQAEGRKRMGAGEFLRGLRL